MAESLEHLVPDRLLERLDSLAPQIPVIRPIFRYGRVKSPPSLPKFLCPLRDTLLCLQDMVLVAEGLPREERKSKEVRDWLSDLSYAVQPMEYLLDELQPKVSSRERKAEQKTWLGSTTKQPDVSELRVSPNEAANWSLKSLPDEWEHQVSETRPGNTEGGKDSWLIHPNTFLRIEQVTRRLKKCILSQPQRLNLFPIGHATPGKPTNWEDMDTSGAGAPDIIGRDEDKKNIIQLLKQPEDGEKVSVLPLVGVGGIGKTTLARWVYGDEEIAAYFENRMWVYVPRSFNIAKIIKATITSATGEQCGNLTLDQLQTRLRNILEGKRYLLILDDVWNTDRREWLQLRALLMGGASGSKILVTTRKIGVGPIVGTVQSYVLFSLSEKDSWTLFLKHSGLQKTSPDLSNHWNHIKTICKGIPLEIRALGSSIRSAAEKKHDWKFGDYATRRSEHYPALELSYEKLPSRLKRCVAFCSIFPKNFEIRSRDLVLLWMMHDLIEPSNQGSTKELADIGNEYIKQLLDRSFFQDFEEREHGTFFSFRMHDIVHDLAASLAKQESVMLTFGAKSIPRMIRRISFSDEDWSGHEQVVADFLGKLPRVETILFPDYGVGLNSESILKICIEKFQSMRVLDLSDSRFKVLPQSIASLRSLRLLSLRRNDRIMNLPASISRMRSLEVLMLGGCYQLATLPEDMEHLDRLRHLEITTKDEALPWLNSLMCLRYLEVAGCVNLKSLYVGRVSRCIALRTLLIHRCPRLASLPGGIRHLSSLKILRIEDCGALDLLDDDDDGDEVPGFRSLWLLVIVKLPRLETPPKWILQAALASNTLQRIVIEACPNFRGLPQEVRQDFKSFQKFQIEC